jgi:hypothetical protein
VIEGAVRHIEREGLEGRCQIVAGSFFEAVPRGADAYILKNVLHDWDDERALIILKNCRRAMRKESRLLVLEVAQPVSGIARISVETSGSCATHSTTPFFF